MASRCCASGSEELVCAADWSLGTLGNQPHPVFARARSPQRPSYAVASYLARGYPLPRRCGVPKSARRPCVLPDPDSPAKSQARGPREPKRQIAHASRTSKLPSRSRALSLPRRAGRCRFRRATTYPGSSWTRVSQRVCRPTRRRPNQSSVRRSTPSATAAIASVNVLRPIVTRDDHGGNSNWPHWFEL